MGNMTKPPKPLPEETRVEFVVQSFSGKKLVKETAVRGKITGRVLSHRDKKWIYKISSDYSLSVGDTQVKFDPSGWYSQENIKVVEA